MKSKTKSPKTALAAETEPEPEPPVYPSVLHSKPILPNSRCDSSVDSIWFFQLGAVGVDPHGVSPENSMVIFGQLYTEFEW